MSDRIAFVVSVALAALGALVVVLVILSLWRPA